MNPEVYIISTGMWMTKREAVCLGPGAAGCRLGSGSMQIPQGCTFSAERYTHSTLLHDQAGNNNISTER